MDLSTLLLNLSLLVITLLSTTSSLIIAAVALALFSEKRTRKSLLWAVLGLLLWCLVVCGLVGTVP